MSVCEWKERSRKDELDEEHDPPSRNLPAFEVVDSERDEGGQDA